MTGRSVMLLMAGSVFLAASALAQQDHAVPRGGGGGGSSNTGAAHTPSFHGGDGSSNPGSTSPSGTPSGMSTAQQRHPRPGQGGGGYYPGGGYPPYYYYPGYYPGYYWWPYGSYGWWDAGWGWGAGWGYPYGGAAYTYMQVERGSIRVLVDPSEARVYVDGYYAGTVDDFDGLFQRLNVSPGKHEIALKLAGYKTHRVKVWIAPESTLKLNYEMEKGSGETFEDLAGDAPDREVRSAPTGDDAKHVAPVAPGNVLRLTVQPADASVYVDGEFRGSGTDVLSLPLAPGRHKIEVVRPGLRTQEREVEIGAQSPTEVTIALERP